MIIILKALNLISRPVYPEELFNHIFKANLTFKMALNFYLYCNPYQNTLPVDFVNNILVNTSLKTANKSNDSLTPTFQAFSYIFILALAFISTPTLTLIVIKYTNKNFQKAIKPTLEFFFQGQKHD